MSATYISLWKLAYKLGTYPDLLRALCKFYLVETEIRGRAQSVSEENARLLDGLLWDWRRRPKADALLGRKPRSRKKKVKARVAREHPTPVSRIK